MHLLNPWALWFLPLTAIPVIIHLFRQRPATATPFPDIRFLKESQTASWRRTRIREWLLLALRMLAILLLVLALARPRVNASLPRWLGGSEGAIILIIDDSASMGVRDGDGTLFDRAKAQALDILDRMSGNSRAAVLSASDGNRIFCGLIDPARARRRVAGLARTDLGTDIPGAIAAAGRIATQSHQGAEIVLVSDLQGSGFGQLDPLPALPAGASLTVVAVAAGRPLVNLIWDKVAASALRKRIMTEGRLQGGGRATIRLVRNGRILYSQPVTAGEGGLFAASFGWPDTDSLTLACSGDDLPTDDCYFLPGRHPRLNVLLVADSAGSGYVNRALAAMAGGELDLLRSENPSGEQWERADAVVFCKQRVSESMARLLRERLDAGVRALLMPPMTADSRSYNQFLSSAMGGAEILSLTRTMAGATGFQLAPAPAAERLGLELDARALGAAEVSAYWLARPAGDPVIRVDGHPALIFRGRTALWLFGAEPDMNTLIYKPAFIVLLHRVLALLGESGSMYYRTGELMKRATGITINGPDGSSPRMDAANDIWLLEQQGWYLRAGPDRAGLIAVNTPPRESDLAPLTETKRQQLFRNIPARSQGTPAARSAPLEFLLLVSVVAALSAEMLLRTSRA